MGLWFEMIAITCVCLCLGLLVGSLPAQPISDMLLAGQIEAAKAMGGLPGGAIASADSISLLADAPTALTAFHIFSV